MSDKINNFAECLECEIIKWAYTIIFSLLKLADASLLGFNPFNQLLRYIEK